MKRVLVPILSLSAVKFGSGGVRIVDRRIYSCVVDEEQFWGKSTEWKPGYVYSPPQDRGGVFCDFEFRDRRRNVANHPEIAGLVAISSLALLDLTGAGGETDLRVGEAGLYKREIFTAQTEWSRQRYALVRGGPSLK